jgi:hypothetical protein
MERAKTGLNVMGRRKDSRKNKKIDPVKFQKTFAASGPYLDFMKQNTIMPGQKLEGG